VPGLVLTGIYPLRRIMRSIAPVPEKRTICLYDKDDLVRVSTHFLKKGAEHEKGFIVFVSGRIADSRRR
jgi:hypothetical protein